MRTIEEIRTALICKTYTTEAFIDELDKLIETVATLQREKCAEEAKIIKLSNSYGIDWGSSGIWADTEIGKVFTKPDEEEDEYKFEIDKESILNAKL